MPLLPIRARVVKNDHVTDQVCITTFELISPNKLTFKAGQYLFLKASDRVVRAYSIASSPLVDNVFEFCVKRVEGGVASNYIWNLSAGQEVDLTGTFGQFVYKHDVSIEKMIFVGTGTGIAPLKSMIEYGLASGDKRPMHLFFGEREKKDFYYLDWLAAMKKEYANFSYTLCASRDHADGFFAGRVTAAMEILFPLTQKTNFYLCGGQAMLTDVRALLQSHNVHAGNIYWEKFF